VASDAEQYAQDARIARLPQWAKELIASQARDLRHREADIALLQERLDGKIRADGPSDTVLASGVQILADGSDVPDTPLGNGAHVRFADFYEVHYGNVGSGARALIVDTDGPLAVVPVVSNSVIIRRA
jgi:hypothetical protein